MSSQEINSIILIADLKNSLEFTVNNPDEYYTLVEEFQNTVKKVINNYASSRGIGQEIIYVDGQEDEITLIISHIDMESAVKYALEIAIYLKLSWRKNDYLRKIRDLSKFVSNIKLPIDIRIGIGFGQLQQHVSAWSNHDVYTGLIIKIVKLIKEHADYAKETLIVVNEDAKNYISRLPSLNIEFGEPYRLYELRENEKQGDRSPTLIYPLKMFSYASQINEEIISRKETYFDCIDSGYAKQIAGDNEGAIEDYKAIEIDPQDAYAYNNRGLAYADAGFYDEAISDFSSAIELHPEDMDFYFNRGLAYSEKGMSDEAIDDFTKAIELDSKVADSYYNRGLIYEENELYDEAISDFTKVIELNPGDADAYFNRGSAYDDKGFYDEAISDYTKAIALNPNDADTYYSRGNVYNIKELQDEAFADFSRAIELNPADADFYSNRGFIYFDRGQYLEAINDFKKAIEINRKYEDAYCGLGITYYKMGNVSLAKEFYSKAINLEKRYGNGTEELMEAGYYYSENQINAIEGLLQIL